MGWLYFDSTAFIMKIIGYHWLIIGFLYGVFKIYARRSKTQVDDEIVELVDELKGEGAKRRNQVLDKPENNKENNQGN